MPSTVRCRDCARTLSPDEETVTDIFEVTWCLRCYRIREKRLEGLMTRFDSPEDEIRRGAR